MSQRARVRAQGLGSCVSVISLPRVSVSQPSHPQSPLFAQLPSSDSRHSSVDHSEAVRASVQLMKDPVGYASGYKLADLKESKKKKNELHLLVKQS